MCIFTSLDDALEYMNQLKTELHKLKNTWPCGIRSYDDETDSKIKALTAKIKSVEATVKKLRGEY